MDSGSNAHEHFIKQRRNFIAASLFVIFYEAADFTITDINILGNHAEIGNPQIVSTLLVIVFCYFLWRYYTACREIGGVDRFSNACRSWAERACTQRIKKKYVKKKHLKKAGSKAARIDPVQRNGWYLTYSLKNVPNSSGELVDEDQITVMWSFWIYSMLSVIPTTLQTSNFTEYLLPYVLAALAILELAGFGLVQLLLPL